MAHTEAHSYVRGTADSPPSDLTIAALLAETPRDFRTDLLSYSANRASVGAGGSSRTRSRPSPPGCRSLASEGDRVGIWSPNRVEWLVTQFATARLGLVLVNINPAYRLAELEIRASRIGMPGCRLRSGDEDLEVPGDCFQRFVHRRLARMDHSDGRGQHARTC